MLSKRKPKKLSNKYVERATGQHELYCSKCETTIETVSRDVARFICSYCVQQMVAPPDNYNKKKDNEGFPRGWHFKKRFEGPDGKIYSFGKLVEEGMDISEDIPKVVSSDQPIKKRGRPKKSATPQKVVSSDQPIKKRGRPKKSTTPQKVVRRKRGLKNKIQEGS